MAKDMLIETDSWRGASTYQSYALAHEAPTTILKPRPGAQRQPLP